MLFALTVGDRTTHCGVLEFTAEEGCCYIPFWMMQNLLIEEGTLITVTNVSLPKATFVKLQPQSTDFLEISNPRAVLEHALRNFSCVTVGDVIQIQYNSKNYHFKLQDVKPGPAACIIETDCNVDFDAPVGYEEKLEKQKLAESQRSSACPSPATATTTASSAAEEEEKKPAGIRIVDGKIIRPDDAAMMASASSISPDMLAAKTGQTGVQKNAAVPEEAPTVDYWAVQAGEGARLDGKPPAALKDESGQEVDVRKLRAEAAARRAEQQAAAAMSASSSSLGSNSASAAAAASPASPAAAHPVLPSKRKKRVGARFSKLKGSAAFHGSAQKFDK
jgi:ubiquitin fusion degradation protein 1